MHPNFEQLIQIVRTVAKSTPHEFLRVVLASSEGEVRLVEITDAPDFRVELEAAFQERFLILGLLGWEHDLPLASGG